MEKQNIERKNAVTQQKQPVWLGESVKAQVTDKQH
jgi:hypothetical protein